MLIFTAEQSSTFGDLTKRTLGSPLRIFGAEGAFCEIPKSGPLFSRKSKDLHSKTALFD